MKYFDNGPKSNYHRHTNFRGNIWSSHVTVRQNAS